MNGAELHDLIDRADSGAPLAPDLGGIMAAGRRRRRRTRAMWTGAGLATAAVVAPLAFVVGGGPAPAPSSPGFAAEPAPAAPAAASASAQGDDVQHAFAQLRAVTAERLPQVVSAAGEESDNLAYDNDVTKGTSVLFELRPVDMPGSGLMRVGVSADTDRLPLHVGPEGQRLSCDAGCERVGERNVAVQLLEADVDAGLPEWVLTVQVTPTDETRTDKVQVTAIARAETEEEARALLPSLESLKALALDDRLLELAP